MVLYVVSFCEYECRGCCACHLPSLPCSSVRREAIRVINNVVAADAKNVEALLETRILNLLVAEISKAMLPDCDDPVRHLQVAAL